MSPLLPVWVLVSPNLHAHHPIWRTARPADSRPATHPLCHSLLKVLLILSISVTALHAFLDLLLLFTAFTSWPVHCSSCAHCLSIIVSITGLSILGRGILQWLTGRYYSSAHIYHIAFLPTHILFSKNVYHLYICLLSYDLILEYK